MGFVFLIQQFQREARISIFENDCVDIAFIHPSKIRVGLLQNGEVTVDANDIDAINLQKWIRVPRV